MSLIENISKNLRLNQSTEDFSSRNLFLGVSGTAALRATSAGLAFLASLLLAHYLGATEFGRLVFLLSWVGLASQLSLLGFDRLLLRFVAAYRSQSQWGSLKGLLGWANAALICLSLLVVGSGMLLCRMNIWGGTPVWATLILIAIWQVPVTVLLQLQQYTLQGLKRVLTGQVAEMLIRPALFVILLAGVGVGFGTPNVAQVLLINLIALGLAAAWAVWMVFRALPPELLAVRPDYHFRTWLFSAFPLFLICGMDMLNSQIDVLMLGILKGPRILGIYAAAIRGAKLVSFILTVANVAIAPTVSGLYAAGHQKKLQQIVTRSSRLIFGGAVLVVVPLLIWGGNFLLFFGPEFAQGQNALKLLCFGQFVNAAMGPVSYLLILTGHGRDAALGLGVGLAANIVLNLWLIPHWGLEGAAFASASSLILWNSLLAWLVWRRLRITTTVFGPFGWG